jgi:hypothetical protein
MAALPNKWVAALQKENSMFDKLEARRGRKGRKGRR